jgi:hypothetical protein
MAEAGFELDPTDPYDLEAVRRVLSFHAVAHAFGPQGGGMAEILWNASIEAALQRKRRAMGVKARFA